MFWSNGDGQGSGVTPLPRTVRYVYISGLSGGKRNPLTKEDEVAYISLSQQVQFFSLPVALDDIVGDHALAVSVWGFGEEVSKTSPEYNLLRISPFLVFGLRLLFQELGGLLVSKALLIGSVERRV